MKTYPLLGELTGTLVPGVAEQLDHTLLIGGETIGVQSQSWWLLMDGLPTTDGPLVTPFGWSPLEAGIGRV